MKQKPLPIGIDNFKTIIQKQYYYVDKTMMIKELLDRQGGVTLFTRPRRFGKTLNMSMLQYFFEDTGNEQTNLEHRALFDGLKILDADDDYTGQMTYFPLISLSLKSAKQPTLSLAMTMLKRRIAEEFRRHQNIRPLIGDQCARFDRIMSETGTIEDYADALAFLSFLLKQCYGKNVIILIDEYDVPLENAYFCHFYEEMTNFLRSLFESALKTNPSLEFAVITGCLRISRESIFTGLNNLDVVSIVSEFYGEHFGFTQDEVDAMLEYYGQSNNREVMRSWYNGYLFCGKEVYNPWSAINYVKSLTGNPMALPKPYWSNTSSNDIVKSLIERADLSIKQELEDLLDKKTIEKPIHEDITYDSIFDSVDTLWNFLFFTGYLKQISIRLDNQERYIAMAIPNEEVMYIYRNTIRNWFQNEIKKKDLSPLYSSLLHGKTDSLQKELSILLQASVSYLDSKEAFYHGFLMGILGSLNEYLVKSNRESGGGRSDIVVRSLNVSNPPVILELKVAKNFSEMEAACDRALEQIETRRYDDWLAEEGYKEALLYGIAFFRKQCKVKGRRKALSCF